MTENIKRVIIDTDPGADDALAILILLEAEARKLIKIEAITLTAGNTTIENACTNIVRLLQAENRTDIPVYKGVQDAFLQHKAPPGTYFGNDGFGDVFTDQVDLSIIREEKSPLVMCDMVNKNPGQITLVCLGPLTNVALAGKLDGTFFDKVAECFIMGGNIQGQGNVTSSGEFNFYYDPEAAYILLKTISCPTTMLPLETCHGAKIGLEWRWKVLGKCPRMALLNKVEESRYSYIPTDDTSYVPYDGYLAILVFEREIVKRISMQHVTVELHGSVTRGQMVVDHLKNSKANVAIVEELDLELFKSILVNMFQINSI